MVSKSDITTNKPTTSNLIQVASGEKVLAEVENANNLLMLNALILAYNWIIDSGVELSAANTFTGTQTFDIIKTAYLESLTGSSDVILRNGTFKYGGTASNLEIATELYVAQQLAGAGSITLPFTFGGIQTTDFTAVSGKLYWIDMASPITVTLPASPAAGGCVGLIDYKRIATSTNKLTIDAGGIAVQGDTDDQELILPFRTFLLYDTTAKWYAS